jgi:hypothetical protein
LNASAEVYQPNRNAEPQNSNLSGGSQMGN